MSKEYVTSEVDKIIKDKQYAFPLNLAMSAAWICGNLKGINLKVLDVSQLSSIADYFVFVSVTSTTQAKAVSSAIEEQLKKHGSKVLSKEGSTDTDWILLDLGEIIVHIFMDSARQSYDLDTLWIKAPRVEIPESYYFSEPEDSFSSPDQKDDYNDKDDLDYF